MRENEQCGEVKTAGEKRLHEKWMNVESTTWSGVQAISQRCYGCIYSCVKHGTLVCGHASRTVVIRQCGRECASFVPRSEIDAHSERLHEESELPNLQAEIDRLKWAIDERDKLIRDMCLARCPKHMSCGDCDHDEDDGCEFARRALDLGVDVYDKIKARGKGETE